MSTDISSSEKCAEIFRNNNTGKYYVICAHCNEQSTSFRDILQHIENHFSTDPYLLADNFHFDSTEFEEKPPDLYDESKENIWITEGLVVVDSSHHEKTKPHSKSINNKTKDINRNKPYKCKLCSKVLITEKLLKSHINMRHKHERNCRKCNKLFKHSKHLSKHLRNVHEMSSELVFYSIFKCKPFKCDECQEPYENRLELKTHLIEVHGRIEFARDPLKCDLCGKWYGTARKLEEHIFEHGTKKPFKCETCDIRYASRASLREHQNTHSSPRYVCDKCGKSFRIKSSMKLHWRIHLNIGKLYQCDLCSEKFNFKHSYIAHLRNHSGEKPFQCAVCGVVFNLNNKLRNHMMRMHSDDPTVSYPCTQCDKQFTRLDRLKIHQRTHSDYRGEQCGVCKKLFKTKKTLRQHLLVHSTVKRFKCKYCNMYFTQSSGRRGHERNRHLS